MYPIQKRLSGDFIEDPNFASDYSLYGTEMANDFGGNYPNIVATAYMDVNTDGAAITARNNKYTVENTSQSPYLRGLMSYISVRVKFIPDSIGTGYSPDTGLATMSPNSTVFDNLVVYITANGYYRYYTNGTNAANWAAHPANAGNTYLGRYRNAYCYYMVYLDPQTSYPLSPYASIRSLFYDMRITQINRLGYPEPYPEAPYPTTPPETETPPRISVDTDVRDWTPVLQP
jgi:hypothetical protein